jgi:flagellar L-ring protein precursor FlgH
MKQWLRLSGCLLAVFLGLVPVGAESLSSAGSGLFTSEKNYQVGDLVTVIVSETSQGEQSASTDLNKETNMGISTTGTLGTVLGSASGGLTSKQKGGGNLARHGRMNAMITARVEKILPNGSLELAGSQEIEFDSGRQRISVKGMARPRDIDSSNQVFSYRLADSQIEYLGTGALGEKARTGYLSRILELLWIF